MDMVDQIDMEKSAVDEERPEGAGYSALPGLVRELIRTPGFKELLLIHLRDINPENASELVKTAVWEDVAFTMSAIGASPDLINWLAQALVELGVQLNNFTLDILRDFLVQLGRDLDVEKLKSVPGAYAPLVNQLLLEDREALDGLIAGLGSITDQVIRAAERTWHKVWNTADFGKIRVGVTGHLEGRMAELEGEPGIINPVAISNLLGIVPPLTNYLLRALTRTLKALNLPGEVLASAVFQLLEDIDQRELGGLVNTLADVVVALHRGNLLLGRDEPRLKGVLERVSRELVENVDGERFKHMLIALKEDGAVIGGVLADYVFATPDSAVQVVRALYLAVSAALRSVGETYRRLGELPPEALGAMVDAYEEAFDVRALHRMVNYNTALFNKVCDVRPQVVSATLGRVLEGLDTAEMARAGRTAALQVKDAVLADPVISAALEPEAVGERINAGLAAFNRFSRENPDLVAEKLSRVLAVLDADELAHALSGVAGQTARAMMNNTDFLVRMARPVVKPVAVGAAALGGLLAGFLALRRLRG